MVKYRLALEQDYKNINDFYNRIYNLKRTMEQFYWEFHNGAYGKSIYVIAEDGDKVVGTNCVIPIELVTHSGETILTGKSEDTLVDPDYRGQKIFYHIYEFLFKKCAEAGIKTVWGFTAAKKPFRNLGFEIPFDHKQSLAVGSVSESYAFLSALNKSEKISDKAKIRALCHASHLKLTGLSKQVPKGYTLVEEPITEGVEELVASRLAHQPKGYAIKQTAAFQQWRIYDDPNYDTVHTFGFYKENSLKGLIVLNSNPQKVAYIIQSNFHKDVEDASAAKMIMVATQKMFEKGVVLIRNWQFTENPLSAEETKLIKKAKYTVLERGVGFVWKDLAESGLDPKEFYLNRIATQGVI